MTTSAEVGVELTLSFTDLLANGQAVGRSQGMAVFCFGPLPGEEARVRIAAIKPKYAVADLLEVIRKSPQRVQPFCPVFGICGGCQIQHLAYPEHLRWKQDVVRNALVRIGGLSDAPVHQTIGMSNPRAYRNKMSLVIDSGCERAGFYKQRSHEIVQIDGCPIAMPALDALIPRVNRLKNDAQTKGAFEGVRHIVARTAQSSGQTVAAFTTGKISPNLRAKAPSLAATLGGRVGLVNTYELANQNAILGRTEQVLREPAQIEESLDGLAYRVSARSFFQVNVEIVERIFAYMRPHVEKDSSIVDLYCGAGTFALFFARLGAHVLGIEHNALAIAEATANAMLNGLQVHFERGAVEVLARRPDIRRKLKAANAIFLDPPRKGADPRALDAIVRSGAPNVWYLSCDPATLARDLKFLGSKDYQITGVQPFDMFPQTGHVEALAMLRRE